MADIDKIKIGTGAARYVKDTTARNAIANLLSKITTGAGTRVYTHNGAIQGDLGIDSTPTSASDNLVTSGGVYTGLATHTTAIATNATNITATQNMASDAWAAASAPYAVGAYAVYNNELWKCLTANSNPPSEGADWTAVKLTSIIGASVNPQYELVWVNNALNFGDCSNVAPTVAGKSWADYNIFFMLYKNIWGTDGTNNDWQTQPIWKNVLTKIEPRGYDPNHSGFDVWRDAQITDSGFTNVRCGQCGTGYCVPMRIYGLKGITYDQWVSA